MPAFIMLLREKSRSVKLYLKLLCELKCLSTSISVILQLLGSLEACDCSFSFELTKIVDGFYNREVYKNRGRKA